MFYRLPISLFVLLVWFAPNTISFTLSTPFGVRSTSLYRNDWPVCMSGHDYTSEEVSEMDNLIMSLSLESNDESRRSKVAALFAEELAKPNGYPDRFTQLFDSVLMIAGQRVQNEARIKAEQQMKEPQAAGIVEDEDDTETEFVPREKTPAELQLWAFIDIMVQTKTLVKKAKGELGNQGSFS
jgi:hypothetical protein